MAVMSKIFATSAALLVVVGLASSTARPVAAAPASASAAMSHHSPAGFPQAATDAPTDWTGWVAKACSTCGLRYVNANFKVPTLDCTASSFPPPQGGEVIGDYWSAWVGLGGYGGVNDLEQVGLYAYCPTHANSGVNGPVYKSFYETVPDGPVFTFEPVSPGDSVSVSVYYTQGSKDYSFYFSNNSQGSSTTVPNIPCPTSSCGNKSAEVIAEVNYPGPPGNDMPDFGSVSFSSTTVTSYDGTKGDLCKSSLWSSVKVQPVDYLGNTLAYAGSLNTCSGPDGFTATYHTGD